MPLDSFSTEDTKTDQTEVQDGQEGPAASEVQEKCEGIKFTKPWDHGDITFVVEGQKVYANKMILSMSSPMMKTMFTGNFMEKNAEEIEYIP